MGQITVTAGLAAIVLAAAALSASGTQDTRSSPKADRVQDQMALALAYHETGQTNEARDALEAALFLQPDYAPALTLMEEYRHRGPQAK